MQFEREKRSTGCVSLQEISQRVRIHTSLEGRKEAALGTPDELVAVQDIVVETLQPKGVLVDDVDLQCLDVRHWKNSSGGSSGPGAKYQERSDKTHVELAEKWEPVEGAIDDVAVFVRCARRGSFGGLISGKRATALSIFTRNRRTNKKWTSAYGWRNYRC